MNVCNGSVAVVRQFITWAAAYGHKQSVQRSVMCTFQSTEPTPQAVLQKDPQAFESDLTDAESQLRKLGISDSRRQKIGRHRGTLATVLLAPRALPHILLFLVAHLSARSCDKRWNTYRNRNEGTGRPSRYSDRT